MGAPNFAKIGSEQTRLRALSDSIVIQPLTDGLFQFTAGPYVHRSGIDALGNEDSVNEAFGIGGAICGDRCLLLRPQAVAVSVAEVEKEGFDPGSW